MNTEVRSKWQRFIAFLCLCGMLSVSAHVQALGVGKVTVLTSLGQSLQAEMDVFSGNQDDLKKLRVRLASQEDFERIGVSRTHNLQQLNFLLKQRQDGSSFVEISSGRPIEQPILDFLVEVVWPEGRILKQYTIFLDPPIFDRAPTSSKNRTTDFRVPEVEKESIIDALLPDIISNIKQAPVKEPVQAEPEARALIQLQETVSPEEPERQQPNRIITAKPKPVQLAPMEKPVVSPPPSPPEVMPVPAPVVEAAEVLSSAEVAELMALEPGPVPAKSVQRVITVEAEPEQLPAPAGLLNELGRTKSGDSLWNIAKAARNDRSVTTQQVMLAILEANPQAFNQSNVNTLKAGVGLNTPSAALVNSLTAKEAAQEINQQWSDYREERQQRKQVAAEKAAQQAVAETKISGPRLRLVVPDASEEGVGSEEALSDEGGSDVLSEEGQRLSAVQGGGDALGNQAETAGTISEDADALENVSRLNQETLGLEQKTDSVDGALRLKSEEFASFQGEMDSPEGGLLQNMRTLLMDNMLYWIIFSVVVFLLVKWFFRRSAAKNLAAITSSQDDARDASTFSDERQIDDDLFAESAEDSVDIMALMEDVDDCIAKEDWGQAISALTEALYLDPHQMDVRFKLIEVHHKTANKEAFIDQAKLFFMESGGGKGDAWEGVVAMGEQLAPEHRLFSRKGSGEKASIIDWGNDEGVEDAFDGEDSYDEVDEDVVLDEAFDDLTSGLLSSPAKAPIASTGEPQEEDREQQLIDQIQQDLDELSSDDESDEGDDFAKKEDRIASEDENFRDAPFFEEEDEEGDGLIFDSPETKLDMARVYTDMGSKKEARRLLKELLQDVNIPPELHKQADEMLQKLGD